jgi:hypothetical protein
MGACDIAAAAVAVAAFGREFCFFSKGIYDCCSITWTIFSHLLQLDDEPAGPFIRVLLYE